MRKGQIERHSLGRKTFPAMDSRQLEYEVSQHSNAFVLDSMKIFPNALNQLMLRDTGLWESTGDEPQFGLSLPDGGLPAGWYAIAISVTAEDEAALSPILYPDYGSGISERNRIPLGAWPGGLRNERQIVKFDQPVQFLRFDPTATPGLFRLDSIELQSISRLGAVFQMLAALAGRGHGWRSTLGRGLTEMREGAAAFIAWLYSSYRFEGVQTGHDDYGRWLRLYERTNDAAVNAERAAAEDGPLISILIPIRSGSGRWLRRCIDSVRNQSYTNWELFLVHEASAERRGRNVLDVYARRDSRIRIISSARGSEPCAGLDSALEIAGGTRIALMRAGDELHRMALAQVALAVQAQPRLQLVYCDEDEIDSHSQRFDPYFKPDWNYDLLLSQNYFGPFVIYSAQLLRSVGTSGRKDTADQDHDRILRCIERIDPAKEIHHIPRVLYHRRVPAGATTVPQRIRNAGLQDGSRPILDHLRRTGRAATVTSTALGYYRIQYALPARLPKVTIVIPTRDKHELLRRCVSSILARTQYPNYELVVMDNQSVERETLRYLEEVQVEARIRVIPHDAPFNYSAINNKASQLSDGELLAFINNDTEIITSDWLEEMVSHAMRPEVGAVGAMLYYPDGKIQHAGVVLGSHGVGRHAYGGKPRGYRGQGARALLTQSYPAVTAACLVVRRQVFEEVAGFDERLQVAFNDIDFCLRLREAGYTNVWTPYAELYHHESATRGHVDDAEGTQRLIGEADLMMARWKHVILNDPAYNPNLSLSAEPYSLAFPPRSVESPDCRVS